MNEDSIPPANIEAFLCRVANSRVHEVDCRECHTLMPELAETRIAGTPLTDELESVQHHLKICSECAEEFETLLIVLEEDER
jgi:hypothetical protein